MYQIMNILITSPIDPDAIKKLGEQHHIVCAFDASEDTLQELIQDRQILIFRSGVSITAQIMECAPELKLLIRAGSGIDNLDVEYTRRRGLKLTRIPGPGAQSVAEMSFAFMLALSRNLLQADRLTRQGKWAKNKLGGYLLKDKILGVIGTGNIGSRVGQMGVAWGMRVIGCDINKSPAFVAEVAKKGIRLTSFDEVVSTADFISIHVPLNDSTRYLIDADALARIKTGAFLIHLARGGVVEERALSKALTEDGGLQGAALDVHEKEGEGKISLLAKLPNVILTPHIGAMTIDSQSEIGRLVIEAVNSFTINHPGSVELDNPVE